LIIGTVIAVAAIAVVLLLLFLFVLQPNYPVAMSQPASYEGPGWDIAGKIVVQKVDSERELSGVKATSAGTITVSGYGMSASEPFDFKLTTLEDDADGILRYVDADHDDKLSVDDYFVVPYGSGNLEGVTYSYTGTLSLFEGETKIGEVTW
jgi:hypothetical protein